jgi:hypothetical protein
MVSTQIFSIKLLEAGDAETLGGIRVWVVPALLSSLHFRMLLLIMITKLQKWQPCRALRRRFSLNCMLIHPVMGTKPITIQDIKAAEEAVGLCNALDFCVIPWQAGGASTYEQDKPSTPI